MRQFAFVLMMALKGQFAMAADDAASGPVDAEFLVPLQVRFPADDLGRYEAILASSHRNGLICSAFFSF